MQHLNEIFEKLGLNKSNGLFLTSENLWKNSRMFSSRVQRLLENKDIKPDAFFCFDNKPFILFYSNPKNTQALHKAIWNFNEAPVIVIIEKDVVEIFNGFKYLKERSTLEKFGGLEKLNDFSYFEIVTGKTWEHYSNELEYKNRIDYHLLNNIKAAQSLLVNSHELDPLIANALIGKCIFVRYLIDREIRINFDGKLRKWNNDEFCEVLRQRKSTKDFFHYLNVTFNGDMFPLDEKDYKQISVECHGVLVRLMKGEEISKGQLSLFELYDFSIIPIEFISNVYELFIGQNNQESNGAYYTPLFLVDFILKSTVERKLKTSDHYNCPVLDPACGSGIFLVEALRKIIEKYLELNPDVSQRSKTFKATLHKLVKDNIFGVDKDPSAVQVAIFSAYLTLLDYQEPPEIESFKFPNLLNTNFFEGDFFDEDASFNEIIKNANLQFILGNPPWKGAGIGELGTKYLNNRKNKEKSLKKYEIAINNGEIVEGFVLRVSDFAKEDCKIALIVRSTILYNLGYKTDYSDFRRYWLEEFFIDRVFELAPVRHEVFDNSNDPAIAPAAVLFYRYANGKDTSKNIIEHITLKASRFFSLFKIFTINRTDFKSIEQQKLKDFDWLWKTLVYGSYLDYNFIQRLKSDYDSVKKVVSDETRFLMKTGIQFSSNPAYPVGNLKNLPFVDAFAVDPFFINPKKIGTLKVEKLHRIRDERIFKAPILLVRKGLDTKEFTAKSAISETDALYKDSLTGIKALNKIDLDVLQRIQGLLNSRLYSYLAIQTFASIGIEREQTQNYNKFSIPLSNFNIAQNIKNITDAKQEIYEENEKTTHDDFKINALNDKIKSNENVIESKINKSLNISPQEMALINYSLEINKAFITKNYYKSEVYKSIAYESEYLEIYAKLFIDRFKPNLERNNKKFQVEIWHTSQIVGMLFKVVSINDFSDEIVWVNKKENSEMLAFLITISTERVTDRLFVQKDIRGFEKNYFYIFKPNEKRLWHEAIGYIDVNEFMSASLKAGRAVI